MDLIIAVITLVSALAKAGKGVSNIISSIKLSQAQETINKMTKQLNQRRFDISQQLRDTKYSRVLEDFENKLQTAVRSFGPKLTQASGVVTALSSTYGFNMNKLLNEAETFKTRTKSDWQTEEEQATELFTKEQDISNKMNKMKKQLLASGASAEAISSLISGVGTIGGMAYNWESLFPKETTENSTFTPENSTFTPLTMQSEYSEFLTPNY